MEHRTLVFKGEFQRNAYAFIDRIYRGILCHKCVDFFLYYLADEGRNVLKMIVKGVPVYSAVLNYAADAYFVERLLVKQLDEGCFYCFLYHSDAAEEEVGEILGGGRSIKKKNGIVR